MEGFIITFRSVTFAQRGERALQRRNIGCRLRRTPRSLSGKGCGYCLDVRGTDVLPAVELLRKLEIPFGKVYALSGERMEEREL